MKTSNLTVLILQIILFTYSVSPCQPVATAQTTAPPAAALEQFAEKFRNPQSLPFSFRYDGKSSAELMPSWTLRAESIKRLDKNSEWRIYVIDPRTGLQIHCEVVQFAEVPVIEWLLHFRNDSKTDTPILDDIQALDVSLPPQTNEPVLHYARGAVCSMNDYQPILRVLNKGAKL